MDLGQVIKQYIREHKMTLRSFALKTGLSSTYLSYIIKNKTSTGKSPSPTIDVYKSCAKAMGMDVDELVRITEGMSQPRFSEATRRLFRALNGASEEEIMKAVKIIEILKQ